MVIERMRYGVFWHVILSHPKRPAYPSKVDLKRLGIYGQRKRWKYSTFYRKVIVREGDRNPIIIYVA
jgi:hypothetical protein